MAYLFHKKRFLVKVFEAKPQKAYLKIFLMSSFGVETGVRL